MKKAVEPNSQPPQKSAAETGRSLRQTFSDGRAQGSLAQLASMMNQSPRVQTQLKLAEEMNQSPSSTFQQPAQMKGKLEEKKPTQMKGKLEDKKKPMQGRFETPIQEKRLEEKKPAQTKPNEKKKPVQGRFEDAAGTAQLEEVPAANRTGLPDQLKSGVESLSGISMDDVKVHYNSDKPKQLNALAYAQGTDIHVGSGQEKHLPHEAWHIVQQKQGRVQPTMQMKAGVPVNDDPRLEHEADLMGAQALQRTAVAASEDDLSSQEDYGHAQDCACPACCQTKSAFPGKTIMDDQESGFTDLQASPPAAVQMRPTGTVQMECSECGKKKGHLSGCSRNPHNRGVITKEKKKVHEENQSWKNLQDYRPGWVRKNGITEEMVKEFCKTYGKIRGHGSGDNSQGEQEVTKQDLKAYKSWHTKQYKSWN